MLFLDNARTFAFWFLENIPEFLLSEPIIYFVGIAFLLVVIKAFASIINIR